MQFMKTYLYYSFCLVLFLSACSDSEKLENRIDFDSPYVIKDDPDNQIQHRRYLIYQEYGIPVFFNDTISETQIATGYDGKPIYQHETLDLNWSFSSHNKNNVEYIVDYFTDPELQAKALDFVDIFLERAPKPMRPFSIFLPNSLIIKEENQKDASPEFWTGFRTLVIPGVQDIAVEDIPEFSTTILRAMVKDKVLKANEVTEKFGEISNKDKYYAKPWVISNGNGGLGCVWGVEHKGVWWKPEELYDEDASEEYTSYYWQTYVSTEEEFKAERELIFEQIGQFGFICGDIKKKMSHLNSPAKISDDLEYYVDMMLNLGSEIFLERYGKSPLVLKKYTILTDYINNELGVDF